MVVNVAGICSGGDGLGEVHPFSGTRRDASFKVNVQLIRRTRVVEQLWDVFGREIQLNFHSVGVGGANASSSNFVPTLRVGVDNRLDVPVSEPMLATVLPCNGCRQLTNADPAVDVHVQVKLLGEMAKNSSHPSSDLVSFSIVHDELSFAVASGAKLSFEVTVEVTLSYHRRRRPTHRS